MNHFVSGAHISLERVFFWLIHAVAVTKLWVQQQKIQTCNFCKFPHQFWFPPTPDWDSLFNMFPILETLKWCIIMVFMLAYISPCKSQNMLLMSSREGEVDYFSLMPFVWRKRCWLTAELLDPTQPGFNADAWLMRSTTGIIIRRGILGFSCVSQAGKTSWCCNGNVGFSASV